MTATKRYEGMRANAPLAIVAVVAFVALPLLVACDDEEAAGALSEAPVVASETASPTTVNAGPTVATSATPVAGMPASSRTPLPISKHSCR